MNLKWILFLIFSFLSRPTFALYGARVVSAGKFSGVASLHLQDPENSTNRAFCAAVLISPTKVLTAGHCIDVIGMEVYDFSMRLINDPQLLRVKIAGKNHEVKSVYYAPSYFEAAGFEGEDVAVIELKEKSFATPLPVASASALSLNRAVTLVAHGLEGKSRIKYLKQLNGHRMMTFDGGTSGACAGDSGGAVIIENKGRFELAGIILSEGEGCERKDSWSVHPSLTTRSL